MREQIQSHFGFEIVLARTEVGGYCAHCQVLRAKEMAAAANDSRRPRRNAAHPGAGDADGDSGFRTRANSGARSRQSVRQSQPRCRSRRFRSRSDAKATIIWCCATIAASRSHARIVAEDGAYFIEDLNSRQGVYVNGQRIAGQKLSEFGPYRLRLVRTPTGSSSRFETDEIHRFLDQFPAQRCGRRQQSVQIAIAGGSCSSSAGSLSPQDVLAAVVDAALAVTGAERGFLLLKSGDELEVNVARDRRGVPLASTDLQVPRALILRALRTRRELALHDVRPRRRGRRPA